MPDQQPALPNSLADWLDYLAKQHNKDIDLGLTRVGHVGKQLDLLNLPGKVILIAGTNGKGTTSRFIEACLLKLGFSTGLFNSPHLRRYNETVRINAQELPDDVHCNAFAHIEQKRGDTSLTAFEVYTLAAFKIFKDNAVDFAIIEVGLGGLQDSTNVVNPDVSVITTVDLDHQAFLGNDRQSIGLQKAGIFRANKPAVVGDLNIPASVLNYGKQLGSHMVCANSDFSFSLDSDNECWSWHYQDWHYHDLPLGQVPQQNAATALAVLQQLNVPLTRDRVVDVLSSLVVEGRLEVLEQQPLLIADVAHNPQAAGYLAVQLARYRTKGYRKVSAVVRMLKDKDIAATLAQIDGQIDQWFLTDLTGPRGAQAVVLAEHLKALHLEKLTRDTYTCYHDAAVALAAAKAQQRSDELVIIFGSFHTIEQARK